MPAIGHIEQFNEENEDWTSYVERLQQYFLANDIGEERQAPAIISLMGSKTYKTLKQLAAPNKPSALTFNEIVATLEEHLSPKPSVISERFRFYKRDQLENESISAYFAELKGLTEHCDFGRFLPEALRDRLVCGLRSDIIQKALLTEKDLSYEKALEIALSMESAACDAVQLSSKDTAIVNKMAVPNNKSQFRRKKCMCCGGSSHLKDDCWYKDETCNKCGMKGHLKRVCTSKQSTNMKHDRQGKRHTKTKHGQRQRKVYYVNCDEESKTDTESESDVDSRTVWVNTLSVEKQNSVTNINVKNGTNIKPIRTSKISVNEIKVNEKQIKKVDDVIWINLKIEGKDVNMELDTGSAVSIIPMSIFKSKFGNSDLSKCNITLRTYTGEHITPCGVANVKVCYDGQSKILPLYVVNTNVHTHALLGRSWLQHININWREIKNTFMIEEDTNTRLHNILDKHKTLFTKDMGKVKDIEVKLSLKEGAKPKFTKARSVPYAIQGKVNADIDRLEAQGILSKVDNSEWASPIVPVMKRDGSVRICADFKSTINPALVVDKYPLPKIEDMYAKLVGGKKFTKLDLAHAYQQLVVDKDSRSYLTINTQKGLYCQNRLPFGLASSGSIFQRVIEQILQGIPHVLVYQDDILTTGTNDTEHLDTLDTVLNRLDKHGIKLKKEKCAFMQDRIEYLGHVIDKTGLHTSPDKVKAIVDAPTPTDLSQLRSFLGLLNYYGRFLPNLATVLHPLYQLQKKDSKWKWTQHCQSAFEKAKVLISSAKVMVHYDTRLPVRLACDASPYGIGAVISHVMPNGDERPIAFASRSLSKSERNYAQIDREALSIVYGVKKFHSYLFGRHFTLLTDHKPLVTIFGPKSNIPALAAQRMQRWALILANHDYSIEYRNTKAHCNADGLSRLPLQVEVPDPKPEADIFSVSKIETFPITSVDIAAATRTDPVLSKVYLSIQNEWTECNDPVFRPYFLHRDEIHISQGCLMWGIRVIIPAKLQQRVLNALHCAHTGIVKMKALARSYVYWPNINTDIENLVKNCEHCLSIRNNPQPAPLHPWSFPTKKWSRIHVDFAGPFLNEIFFVIIDSYSKWTEVFVTKSTTAEKTIEMLRETFARYGLPDQLVSDNGPQFTSELFRDFMITNGIRHIKSAPFHPATNGQAERVIGSMKSSMKANRHCMPVKMNLANFLLSYRNTVHATTGETPAKLFLGDNLRTRLDLLRPDIQRRVYDSQTNATLQRNQPLREFQVNDPVMIRNYSGGKKWLPAHITNRNGPVNYQVQSENNTTHKRHVEQIISRHQHDHNSQNTKTLDNTVHDHSTECAERRYPQRQRKPVVRLDL